MNRSLHASREEWEQYLEGELTQARAGELEKHRLECEECRRAFAEIEALFGDLLHAPEKLVATDLLPAIQSRLAEPAQERSRPWIPIALAAGVAAAISISVIDPSEEVRVKSAAPATADAWVGLEAFAIGSDGVSLRALRNDPISPRDALAFAYRNIGATPFGHLMIFGRGASGEVVWYYPEYTDASADPPSISIQRGVFDLPDRVSHELPPGTLFIYGLFTRTPHSVKHVEALARSVGAGERLPIEDSGQHILRVEVTR